MQGGAGGSLGFAVGAEKAKAKATTGLAFVAPPAIPLPIINQS